MSRIYLPYISPTPCLYLPFISLYLGREGLLERAVGEKRGRMLEERGRHLRVRVRVRVRVRIRVRVKVRVRVSGLEWACARGAWAAP